jgi:hypothetical protein
VLSRRDTTSRSLFFFFGFRAWIAKCREVKCVSVFIGGEGVSWLDLRTCFCLDFLVAIKADGRNETEYSTLKSARRMMLDVFMLLI